MRNQIVWTIAGSDSGGGAGIQADLKTFHRFGVHGCSVITAITAQNSCAVNHIEYTPSHVIAAQLQTLQEDLPATAIKLGMQGNTSVIIDFLSNYTGKVVLDPVITATSGVTLTQNIAALDALIARADVITPNIAEAERLTGLCIKNHDDMVLAANALQQSGAKAVIIKGGHFNSGIFNNDYYCDAQQAFWLAASHIRQANTHGSGCTLAAAITAALALGYQLADAFVIAKMYVHQGIRLAESIGRGEGAVIQHDFPAQQQDLPLLSDQPVTEEPIAFAPVEHKISLYPVVDTAEWVLRLAKMGVMTIQLRIKAGEIETEIRKAVAISEQYGVRLFINDYWQLALKYYAYGVHLGQEDLRQADLTRIRLGGLRLGISTHCFYEVARAHGIHPSYIACGPVFATSSKPMSFAPQGIQRLIYWRTLLDYPLVAIGGINLERIGDVAKTGVDGVAMISAITHTDDPESAVCAFQKILATGEHRVTV